MARTAREGSRGKRGGGKGAARRSAGRGDALPGAAELLALYRDMVLIRRFEERAGQLYGMGLIGGFCHLYIGQEAVVVGMQSTIDERDSVVTSYRDHGHILACGTDAGAVMAELTGRIGGCSKGKGGSMHMFARENGFYGGHGIVGAQVPIGTGLAFASRYRGTDGVTLTYLGDGAVNQGQVSESFNMARLWNLPVVYVIENNRYGMGTSVDRASAAKDLGKLGEPYGIPGRDVDGMDVLAVREAGAEAVAGCRAGNGPCILEMRTYRYRGHSMSDPAQYRTREEVAAMRERHDPIANLGKVIVEAGHGTEESLGEIDREMRAAVAEAARFAQDSPEPDSSELHADVLVDA